MESSALDEAIAGGLLVPAPTLPPEVFGLQGFELVDRMVDWLDANTLVRDPFPVPSIEAILAEAFPNATGLEIRAAAGSIDQRWLRRGQRVPRADELRDGFNVPVDNYSAINMPGPELSEEFAPRAPLGRSFGKPIGLGVALLLVPLLCVALFWALT